MIEKFLEKFLPQITERLNENEEVGKALIEALAVLDNYATINNVQFTDEQVNTMLGIVPEPAPEPKVDIPAEIVNIVEQKKRGRKPKAATTPSAWTWRFKTKQELQEEFGLNRWEIKTFWNLYGDMDYLFGKPIIESDLSKQFIKDLLQPSVQSDTIDTNKILGIDSGSQNNWIITEETITNKPLPTAAAPTTWSWRFKTEQELFDEFGIDWRIASKPSFSGGMEYLFGQPIAEIDAAKDFIKQNKTERVDTEDTFGITSSKGIDLWFINTNWLTQKPLPTAAVTNSWNWRFKTEEEFKEEYGDDWINEAFWSGVGGMDYLFGEEIAETSNSRDVISLLQKGENNNAINTFRELGITSGGDDDWVLQMRMLTNKPLPTAAAPATQTTWNWRFKTEKELREEYGGKPNGSIPVMGSFVPDMFYLFGKPIEENDVSKKFIEDLKNEPYTLGMDTKEIGISNGVKDTYFFISRDMVTNKPLPTAATPAKTPKKRGRKPKSELPEIDLGGLEDIGDIDIDDIDFDNLVI